MKRTIFLMPLTLIGLLGCAQQSYSYDYSESIPNRCPYVANQDPIDPIYNTRLAYYYDYVLPLKERKTDGSQVTFDDVVVPYRYGEFSGHSVMLVTYLNPANQIGRLEGGSSIEKASVTYDEVTIDFVGHRGMPFVWTYEAGNSYRPESSDYGAYVNGAHISGVFASFLTFEEALKLNYFTDDDLRGIAASADAIRNDKSLWHWAND